MMTPTATIKEASLCLSEAQELRRVPAFVELSSVISPPWGAEQEQSRTLNISLLEDAPLRCCLNSPNALMHPFWGTGA